MIAIAARLRCVVTVVVLALSALHAVPAASAETPPARADRPRRNLRLALAMGQGAVSPPLCSGCDSFWGRSLSLDVQIGWTLRPDLVVALEEQLSVIYFADHTDGMLGGFQLSALYFFRPRAWALAGAGLGLRGVSRETTATSGPREWRHAGVLMTVGAGYELGRLGAWSVDAQARVMTVIADAVAPGIMLLIGAAWN